jgi:hypothetical protein
VLLHARANAFGVSFGGGSCAPDWRDDKSLVT